eukprot:3314777-Alexandrium_andersonii.AAC.1
MSASLVGSEMCIRDRAEVDRNRTLQQNEIAEAEREAERAARVARGEEEEEEDDEHAGNKRKNTRGGQRHKKRKSRRKPRKVRDGRRPPLFLHFDPRVPSPYAQCGCRAGGAGGPSPPSAA